MDTKHPRRLDVGWLRIVLPYLGVLLAAPLATPARAEGTPEGRWYAEGGAAEVKVERCGDALCGRIVSLRSPFDENGCPLTDRQNPDEALRGRSIVGLQFLEDLRPEAGEPDHWTGGTIYDPTSGRTYSCQASLDGPDRLRVRGYFGLVLLGRTTTWVRVGRDAALCAQSALERSGAGS